MFVQSHGRHRSTIRCV
uniref:Uncharacterized protein n=1 Tax=Arundo donax TaxID=35708 RepID=A0A0A9A1M4_ARUDO